MLRRVVEKLSRNRVLRRRLPSAYGGQVLYVTPDALLRYWRHDLGKIDPMLLRFAAQYVTPGLHVWDVGANMGLFTFAAAYKAGSGGSVLALEPDVFLVTLLRRSAEAAPLEASTVRILPVAADVQTGVARFSIAARGRASNHLSGFGRLEAGGARTEYDVPTVSLDSLLASFPMPNVLKIDVEGAELRVLQGAFRVLEQARPIVLLEMSVEANDEIQRLFADYVYRVTTIDGQTFRGFTHGERFTNVLASPR